LWSFGIFFSILVCLDQEKSGNPASNKLELWQSSRKLKFQPTAKLTFFCNVPALEAGIRLEPKKPLTYPGLPDFFRRNIPRQGKIYQIAT
jgi:hypothetical protein